MNNEPVAYINVEKRKLEWAEPITWNTPTIAQMDKIPLYTHPSEHDLGIAEAIGFDKGHKSAEDMLRQQQEKLTKYELRNIAQCDRIAILEAQLKQAQNERK